MPTLSALLLAAVVLAGAGPTSVEPARFSWSQARELARRLHPRTAQQLEEARRSGRLSESAGAAAELCALGNRSGRACAQAEKQAGSLPRRASLL